MSPPMSRPSDRSLCAYPFRRTESAAPERLVVRGEILFHKESFAELNAEQEAQGLPTYVNARNTASGSLKQKDSRETAKRKLTAYIYSIVDSSGADVRSEWEVLQWLRDLGFNIITDARRFESLEDVIDVLPDLARSPRCLALRNRRHGAQGR